MPGPRKNLTPLDMQMLGLAYNQGGIINFLGKQPEVTAPVRAQSHADSPATQLAYITDAEKDLLVNANIHGSMAGQPNPGPAGLESLDDWFNIAGGAGIGGGSTADSGPEGPTSSNNQNQTNYALGGGGSSEAYGIGAGQAVGGGKGGYGGTVFGQTSEGGWTSAGQDFEQAYAEQQQQLIAAAQAQAAADKGIKDKKDLEDLSNKQATEKMKELLKTPEGHQRPGKHKLRAQWDYLMHKYALDGKDFSKTAQAKVLANYLSGVAVERGGGLGARDETYGAGGEKIDPTDPAEIYRQEILGRMKRGGGQLLDYLKSDDYKGDLAQEGLTPEQYYNFRQQLMAADPSKGNMGYKEAFPISSGQGIGKLAGLLNASTLGLGAGIGKEILGIEDKQKPEWAEFDSELFYDTSIPEQGGGVKTVSGAPMIMSGPAVPAEIEAEIANLTPTGIAGANLTPTLESDSSYPNYSYVDQGISPQFGDWYEHLSNYYS